MKRLVAIAAVALAALAGTARADDFAVVSAAATPLVLPSAEVPNASSSLVLPPEWMQRAGAVRELSYAELQALWSRAGAAYGIPWQVLAAINKIESNFGRNMGPSSAGAVGWMQFMPDTWLRWGMDANGDGLADPWTAEDGVYSAARYLAAAGGRHDVPRAIFAYNHADWYVRDVLELAGLYGAAGADVTFSLDRLELGLDQAEEEVVSATAELVDAARAAGRLGRSEAHMRERASEAELLSDSLALQKRAGLIGVRRAAAEALVEELSAGLEQAEHALEAARESARAPSFAGGASLIASPSYAGEYVFPVGGGPSAVSVSRHHHDYPAADIAAPAGAPVYALADAIVVSAWHLPEARCGIGATIETADGQTWTYCHLAYLDSA
ncbi:MAG: lytic murein transglycosylase, partial [Gaiellaceae bacterium]